MNTIIILLLGVSVAPVFSEIFNGLCPTSEVDVVKNFDQAQFQGFWHVLERYEENEYMSCARYRYSWEYQTREFEQMLRERRQYGDYTETQYTQSVLVEKEKLSDDGEYVHRYSLLKFQNFHFVDTDYENYAVLWSCLQKRNVNEQNLVVMARDPFFDINSLEDLNATLAKPPFDRSLLKHIDQEHKMCNR